MLQVKQGVTKVADELAKYDPNTKFPYEKLKGKDNSPTGVDPSNKEVKCSLAVSSSECMNLLRAILAYIFHLGTTKI